MGGHVVGGWRVCVCVFVCLCGAVYYPRGGVSARHRQSKEASTLWSHHEETRQLPGERDNARNSARCTQARKTTHGLDGQHQNVDWTLRG